MCAAEGCSATEYETERRCISRVDRGESPNNIPVLLDEYRAWEMKVLLNLEELSERRTTLQALTPDSRREAGGKIVLESGPPDSVESVWSVARCSCARTQMVPMLRQAW